MKFNIYWFIFTHIVFSFLIIPLKYYLAETNDLDRVFFDHSNHHLKQKSNKQIGFKFKHATNRHVLKFNQSQPNLRIKKRKNILNNKRRIILQNKDAFNDYVTVSVGKSAVLECNLENYNNEKIVWLKMPKGELLTLDENRVTTDNRVYSECDKNKIPCWMLHIDQTVETDSGYYVCQTNSMQTKYIYLDVLVPPSLLNFNPLMKINVDQNQNISLSCIASGKPQPNIFWYKYINGSATELEKHRNQDKITLYIDRHSTNEYECVADNNVPPTVSKKIFLNIQLLPKIEFMNQVIYQKRDRDVIFDCIVHSNPEPVIEWYSKNGDKIIESDKYNLAEFRNGEFFYYRLYVKALNENDFGDYTCIAYNDLGRSKGNIILTELIIPSTTIIPTMPVIPTSHPLFQTTALLLSSASETSKVLKNLKNISKKIELKNNSKEHLINSSNGEKAKLKLNSNEKIASVKGHKNETSKNFGTTNYRSNHQQNKPFLNKLTNYQTKVSNTSFSNLDLDLDIYKEINKSVQIQKNFLYIWSSICCSFVFMRVS